MYKLTLTYNERKAIDWVGYRYSNGDDLYRLLAYKSEQETFIEWNTKKDITFLVPENIAWEIAQNAEKEDGDNIYNFPCFDAELTSKMYNFCFWIV